LTLQKQKDSKTVGMTKKIKNSASQVIKVGVIGGGGYTGGELIRLLVNHPHVQISFINSKSNANKPVSSVHFDLLGETDLVFSDGLSEDIDVLFLCVGHGDAKKFLDEGLHLEAAKIIDLSQDFRLIKNANYHSGKFVYGLPELNKEEIKAAKKHCQPWLFCDCYSVRVATPG